ncbi:CDP-glycerol glycerophosphotransferase family protein [Actinomyces procaprae]|uniref:CDP-glycerol glycerophosphotransferase family protein n=1 Tax=Actinomyces procaprae TaxID=2560010 RepID=UPI00109D88AB|nr:CDP-glycerol glycerophosphotransferase family protein [Actinomyces procaprae]
MEEASSSIGAAARNVTKTLIAKIDRTRAIYAEGNEAMHDGDLERAEALVRQAVQGAPGNAAWIERLGLIQERAKRYSEAAQSYERAIAIEPGHSEWLYRLGTVQTMLGNKEKACESYCRALSVDPDNQRAGASLAASIPKNTPAWRRLELLETAYAAARATKIRAQLIGAALAMHKYERVIELACDGETSTPRSDLSRDETICLSRSFLAQNQPGLAYDALLHDVNNGVENPIKLLTEREYWAEANLLYREAWNRGERDHVTAFGLAMTLDRQYLWEESLPWYRKAFLCPGGEQAYSVYKYAHALERLERWEDATIAYARALALGGKRQDEWVYRLGYCLTQQQRYDSAYAVLQRWIGETTAEAERLINEQGERTDTEPDTGDGGRSISVDDRTFSFDDIIEAESQQHRLSVLENSNDYEYQEVLYTLLARTARAAGDRDKALKYYRLALCAQTDSDSAFTREVADYEYALGLKELACQRLLDSREFFRPDGINRKKLIRSEFDRRRLRYAEYRERFALDKQCILFEAFWGSKISDSPLAIYEALLEDPRYSDYTFYWTVNGDTVVPERLKVNERTFLVRYGSVKYDKILATAAILINNTSFVEYFARRDGQRYINTWHGTPLKTLGKRIGTGVLEHANVTRNFLNCTDILLPNQHTADVIEDDYDLRGFGYARVQEFGSPRLDKVVNSLGDNRREVLRRIGVAQSHLEDRVVFYAPTWRGSADAKSMDVAGAVHAVEVMAAIPGITVLFRAHHLAESMVAGTSIPAITVPDSIDTYDVLAAADVLVTDYSSLLFDFLVTGRQAIAYVPDIDEYRAERGLYMDPEEVVDDVARNDSELRALLDRSNGAFSPGEVYSRSQQRYSSCEDGRAAARVADLLMAPPDARSTSDGRKVLVFAESLIPNGIRSSLLNLLRSLDHRKYKLAVALNVLDVERDERRQQGLTLLPDDVAVYGRNGHALQTLEQRYATDMYLRSFGDVSQPIKSLAVKGHQAEFRRVFGAPTRAVFIDFEGYSRFWNELFAHGVGRDNGTILMLHNQMAEESTVRFPYIAEVLRNAPAFGAVASVARSIEAANREAIRKVSGHELGECTIHNSIDGASIIARSREPGSLWNEHPEAELKIVAIGRLSPEKNHRLLIDALKCLKETFSGAQAMIIGDGPLAPKLREHIRDSGLEGAVHLVGQLTNPMPTLADSDVFAMPSLHEGQPMVIFEALTLGIPVVVTPVPGCVEAVEGRDGCIVAERTVSAFADALRNAAVGAAPSFAHSSYNAEALEEFERVLSSVEK